MISKNANRPLDRVVGILCVLLLGTAVVAGSREASAQSREPEPGTLHLSPERFELENGSYGEAQRGVYYAPMDRSRSDAGVVGVVFHRFPAADSVENEAPPIFRLHGGPGFGGLELDDPGYYEANVEPYTAFSDVIVVGQRGFAPSVPSTECEGIRAPMFDPVAAEKERAEALQEASRKCRAYWQDKGLALEGITVQEAAADVADIASALDYDQISLWGVSFGSHWAMAILRYHPDLVARALIGGTEGPNHTYDMPSGILSVLERVSEDAHNAPELQPWIPEGGLVSALRETIERVERDPPTLTVKDPDSGEKHSVTITAQILRTVADGYSSGPDSLHEMASWPADVLRLHAGRFKEIGNRALPGEEDEWSRIPSAAFFLFDCASGISQERADELFSDPATDVVGPTAWFYRVACPVWDVDLGDDFRTGFQTDVPTLVVHGNWDLSTPYENAQELMPSFSNGMLVTVDRGTHSALDEAMETSDSFRRQVMDFLRRGDRSDIPERVQLPTVDWVVPAELPPVSRRGEAAGSSK